MYDRILVPLDGSETAQAGLREAIALAGAHHSKLLLLHVVDEYPALTGETTAERYRQIMGALRQQGLAVLARARNLVEASGLHCETLLREVAGDRVSDIIRGQAAQHHCDLVVMGTHGRRGLARLALGSQAEQVARTIPVPLLLVRAQPAIIPA